MSNSSLNYYTIYLIGLIPLGLVAGPLIGELILFFIFLLFIFDYIKKKHTLNFEFKIFKYFGLFCLYISIVSLFSKEILISLKSSLLYIRFGLYTVAIIYFLNLNNNSINIIYNFYRLTIIFVILDSFIQIFLGFDLFGLRPNNSDLMRISGPFGDKYILGSFIQKILPVFIYLFLKKFEVNRRLSFIDILISIVSVGIIYRSGDRSAFGLILLFCAIFFFLNRGLRKKIIISLLSFIFIATLLSIQNPKIFKRNFLDTFGQFKGQYYENFLKEEVNETKLQFMIFSFHHQTHYSTALRMFLDKPIFGHGVKMFRYNCKDFEFKPKIIYGDVWGNKKKQFGCSTHPHNTYLQFLSETGLIGFSIIFSVFIYFSIMIIRMKKNKKNIIPESALVIAIFVNLWPLIPTGNFFNNWLSMTFYLPVAFYLYELKLKQRN